MGQSSNDVIPRRSTSRRWTLITQELLPVLEALAECSTKPAATIRRGHQDRPGPTCKDAVPIRLGQDVLRICGPGPARGSEANEGTRMRLAGAAPGWHGRRYGDQHARRVPPADVAAAHPGYGPAVPPGRQPLRGDGQPGRGRRGVGVSRRWPSACRRSPTISAGSPRAPAAGSARSESPELQPGSSIMPGKVNPVIPEAVMRSPRR